MSSKFLKTISDNGNDTLVARANIYEQRAKNSQQELITFLENRKFELIIKLGELTDLGPDTKDSLRPGAKNWDPKQWVKEIQETKQQIYDINIQLKLANETMKEMFEDEDTKGYERQVRPRSSEGILNTTGTIDADYTNKENK
jgi:hypothetical protein